MATAITPQAPQSAPCSWITNVCTALHDLVMKVINAIRDCFWGSQPSVPQTATTPTSPTLGSSRVTVQPSFNLVDFYRGTAANNNGVTLDQILGWNDAQLESVHNYIQWLFPMRTQSGFNHTAPTLDAATIQAFQGDPALRNQMLRSFRRMLAFYGLQMNEATRGISRAANFDVRARVWLYSPAGHHNFLRITRILQSMSLLGLSEYSRAFLAILGDIVNNEGQDIISLQTFGYWQRACS
jgi:hypothetical protein